MIYGVIELAEIYPFLNPNNSKNISPKLTQMVHSNSAEFCMGRKYPAVLICPGGAYCRVSDREGEIVAEKFYANGFNAYVLNYSVYPNCSFPQSLAELACAVNFIRTNADLHNILIDKLFVCGFSAGGHLAASLGVYWDKLNTLIPHFELEHESCKPDGLILCYPVITAGEFTHQDSIFNLLGKKPTQADTEFFSLENQVSFNTPKTFIWHTFSDTVVPVENTLLFTNALAKNKIPFEMHIFPDGLHGLSLATNETAVIEEQYIPHVSNWFNLCLEWTKSI